MEWLKTLLLVVNVLSAAAIVGLVLLQHGKGADMGAAFGSGASGSLFGASGSANFLSRSTAAAAAVFFVTCLGLSMVAGRSSIGGSVMSGQAGAVQQSAPQAPAQPQQNQQIPN